MHNAQSCILLSSILADNVEIPMNTDEVSVNKGLQWLEGRNWPKVHYNLPYINYVFEKFSKVAVSLTRLF